VGEMELGETLLQKLWPQIEAYRKQFEGKDE